MNFVKMELKEKLVNIKSNIKRYWQSLRKKIKQAPILSGLLIGLLVITAVLSTVVAYVDYQAKRTGREPAIFAQMGVVRNYVYQGLTRRIGSVRNFVYPTSSPVPSTPTGVMRSTAATTRYVATSIGQDSGRNCTSSGSPCKTIQYAINQAVSGDEIRVASGTYTSTANPVVTIDDKSLVIKGGYATNDWNTQNPEQNETKIDGQNQRKNVVIKDSDSSSNLNVTLDGFTITNGRAENEASGIQVYPTFACQTAVSSREIMYVNLSHNRIVNNYSQWGLGVGVYLLCCHANLDKNIITGNTNLGTYGSGVYIGRSVVKMTGNFIGLNRLGSPWSTNPTYGHGIFVDNSPSNWSPVNSVTLSYNTIASNKEYEDDPADPADSDVPGDGLFAQGGGVVNITRSIISGHRTGVKKALTDITQITANGNLWFNNANNWENIGTVSSSYTGDPKLAGDSYHLSTCTSSAACNKFSCSFVTPYPLEAYDVDDELRPVGSLCDYGADEWRSTDSPSPSPSPLPPGMKSPAPSPSCTGTTNLPKGCPCSSDSQCYNYPSTLGLVCGRDDDGDGYLKPETSSGFCVVPKRDKNNHNNAYRNDCDDTDRRVNMSAGFYPTARSNGSWDYNCDNVVTKQYNASCTTNLTASTCTTSRPSSGRSGFVGSVPTTCGQSVLAIKCLAYRTSNCTLQSPGPGVYGIGGGPMCVADSYLCPKGVYPYYYSYKIENVYEKMGCR
ncbi:MAG TPA: DUF1565 domain-containing protein [Candidatus Bathyarchaeia archaeon]|nr:DUF1565 domain-containing protein [Candidatus Bathyarchaeia archaeon]